MSIGEFDYGLNVAGENDVAFRADRLRELRSAAKITQEALAKEIGVSERMLRDYEKGRGTPKANHLATIADVLQTNIEYLLDRTTYAKPLSNLHYQVWGLFDAGNNDALRDLLRKHLSQKGIGKLPISRK